MFPVGVSHTHIGGVSVYLSFVDNGGACDNGFIDDKTEWDTWKDVLVLQSTCLRDLNENFGYNVSFTSIQCKRDP